MTRQEQIEKAVTDSIKVEHPINGVQRVVLEPLTKAFELGAEWADAHPHWISVEDELPKDGECVATINTVGVKDVRHYSHGKWYSNFGNEYDDITHWMRLPAEPKKGGAQ